MGEEGGVLRVERSRAEQTSQFTNQLDLSTLDIQYQYQYQYAHSVPVSDTYCLCVD